MFCTKCGTENLNTQICTSCGVQLQSSAAGYAGFWKRLVALVIDSVILTIAGMLLGFIVGMVVGIVMGASGTEVETISLISSVIGFFIGMVLNWLYFTLLESSSKQATVGKMALGLIVTDLNGNKISFANANGRYWSKLVSAIILLIGYIMAGFTEKKQALHDIMAGTLVMNK